MELLLIIACIGLFTGFLSGLLGIGGGIIMAPLLLYIPVIFGHSPLTMQTVAGLTIVQGLVACLAGGLTHRKFKFLSDRLAIWMGTTLFIFSFIGGVSSRFVTNQVLMIIFAVMAYLAASIMLFGEREDEYPDVTRLDFSRPKSVLISAVVGFFGGLVGQGGSFLLIPLMTSFLKIPTRIAIGTNLAIVSLSTVAGFTGKAITGQIVWPLTLPVVLTVIPAAYIGAILSRRTSVGYLRIILAVCIAIAAFRIGFSALGF